MLLESSCCRQRHLLHHRRPCDQNPLSDNMTKEPFTTSDTYSVFPKLSRTPLVIPTAPLW